MHRREVVTAVAAGLAATGMVSAQTPPSAKLKGRIKQGCMLTNFPANMPFDDMCRIAAEQGIQGLGVVKSVNSPPVKMLFDIYHVQIMDGDVAHNIHENIQHISHFHAGGVPDRHEIDETQEPNYRFIAQAIVDAGFTGHVSHEYRPAPGHDPVKSLKRAIEIMDV